MDGLLGGTIYNSLVLPLAASHKDDGENKSQSQYTAANIPNKFPASRTGLGGRGAVAAYGAKTGGHVPHVRFRSQGLSALAGAPMGGFVKFNGAEKVLVPNPFCQFPTA